MSVELGDLFLKNIEKITDSIRETRRNLQDFSLQDLEDLQRDILSDVVQGETSTFHVWWSRKFFVLDDLPDQREVSFDTTGSKLQASKASSTEWSKCGGDNVEVQLR